jgi:hypothetical protein
MGPVAAQRYGALELFSERAPGNFVLPQAKFLTGYTAPGNVSIIFTLMKKQD